MKEEIVELVNQLEKYFANHSKIPSFFMYVYSKLCDKGYELTASHGVWVIKSPDNIEVVGCCDCPHFNVGDEYVEFVKSCFEEFKNLK